MSGKENKVPHWAKVVPASASLLPSADKRRSLLNFTKFPTTDDAPSEPETDGYQNLLEGAEKIRYIIANFELDNSLLSAQGAYYPAKAWQSSETDGVSSQLYQRSSEVHL